MLWVAVLHISDATAQKIRGKHGIEPDEIRDAIVCVDRLWYVEHEHHQRGLRILVRTRVREAPTIVVLYPENGDPQGDVWHLGSAYPVPR